MAKYDQKTLTTNHLEIKRLLHDERCSHTPNGCGQSALVSIFAVIILFLLI